MRCIALAQAWQAAGGRVRFLMRQSTGLVDELLSREGWSPETLSSGDWAETARRAKELGADWVVLDGYDFGDDYEGALAKSAGGGSVLAIDDAPRESAADVLVLPGVLPSSLRHSSRSRTLAGWKFALLRREFHPEARNDESASDEILVVMGGTDAANLLPALADQLSTRFPDATHRVRVVSAADLPGGMLRAAPSPDLHKHMSRASVIVCTASTTALEACALGVPQVLLVVASNQQALAQNLSAAGSSLLAEDASLVPTALANILADGVRDRMASAAKSLVDGKGAERVARRMMAGHFSLRAVEHSDSDLLLRWANDPTVRAASFRQDEIPRDVHEQWLEKRLRDASAWLRLAVDRVGKPFGLLRIEGEEPLLSVLLAASHRGIGLGGPLLTAGCAAYFREHRARRVLAEVKPSNVASRRAFEAAGFSMHEQCDDRVIYELQAP